MPRPRGYRTVLLLAMGLALPAHALPAHALEPKPVNADQIAALEQRAEMAHPEEQCYLFAQVVSELSVMADQQLANGQPEMAGQTLARMESYSARIHQGLLLTKHKKLKETEILVRETARRMDGVFHHAAIEQQEMLRGTLHRLEALQSELMLTVFEK